MTRSPGDIRRESLGRIVQPDVAFQADVADVTASWARKKQHK